MLKNTNSQVNVYQDACCESRDPCFRTFI